MSRRMKNFCGLVPRGNLVTSFWGEIDDQNRLLIRASGIATYGVLPGYVILGPDRTPMLEGIRLAGYGQANHPPQLCDAGCGKYTGEEGGWRYKDQVACGAKCYEVLKKRAQRDKDGKPHRWHKVP
jgi:hypothetical protein